jgi:hypothetical protein
MIKQRSGHDCGQCAVARLTDSTYDQVVKVIGNSNSTKTKVLVKAIRELGWLCDDRLGRFGVSWHGWTDQVKRGPGDLTRALVRVRYSGKSSWHWIAVIDGMVYDPAYWNSLDHGRATSFLNVWRVE